MKLFFDIKMNNEAEIGQIIKKIFENSNLKVNDFANRIGTVRQNVYKIFERKDIDTGLLLRISEVLQHDFFQYYKPNLPHEIPLEKFTDSAQSDTELNDCKKELTLALKEIDYLKKIIDLMEDRAKLIALKAANQIQN